MSAAGTAGADSGGDSQQQGTQQGEGQQGTPDIGQVMQQLQEMNSGLEQVRSQIVPQQQEQGGLDPATLEALGLDPEGYGDDQGYDQEGQEQPQDPTQVLAQMMDPTSPDYDPTTAAQMLPQILEQNNQRLMQNFQEQLAARDERLNDLNFGIEAQQLVNEIPQLGEPETAREVATALQQFAQSVGQPNLTGNAQALRLMYFALNGAKQMRQESQAAPDTAFLEQGGVGAPPQQEQDPAQAIVGARRGGVLPF